MPEEVGRAAAAVALLGGLLGGVPGGPHLDLHPGSLQGEDPGPAGQGSIPPPTRAGGRGYTEALVQLRLEQTAPSSYREPVRSVRSVLAEEGGEEDVHGEGGRLADCNLRTGAGQEREILGEIDSIIIN